MLGGCARTVPVEREDVMARRRATWTCGVARRTDPWDNERHTKQCREGTARCSVGAPERVPVKSAGCLLVVPGIGRWGLTERKVRTAACVESARRKWPQLPRRGKPSCFWSLLAMPYIILSTSPPKAHPERRGRPDTYARAAPPRNGPRVKHGRHAVYYHEHQVRLHPHAGTREHAPRRAEIGDTPKPETSSRAARRMNARDVRRSRARA